MPSGYASAQNLPLKMARPDASFTFSPANPVVGQEVQFTDTSTGGDITAWEWDFDDGETSSLQNPTHSFSEDGSQTQPQNAAGQNVSDIFWSLLSWGTC
jgi:PKD repeat protein